MLNISQVQIMGIHYAKKVYSDEVVYSLFEETIQKWFKKKFGQFTPPQKMGIKLIAEGKNVLITSPTGSGKTLTAFIYSIDYLYRLIKKGELKDNVYVLYVSPLKALNNDIERNLKEPLQELAQINQDFLKIRVAIRSGDSTSSDKARMLKNPPHILITTSESLGIALNAPQFSKSLESIKHVIIDEVHAFAENKRGSHLSLSLERLYDRIPHEVQRIGLSATVHPLDEMAKFVWGMEGNEPREGTIVDVNYTKKQNIEVISPVEDFIYTSNAEVSHKLYGTLNKLIEDHKTTLVFTNTRSATERVVFHLKQKMKEESKEVIAAHHSSMSRDLRLNVEEKLKKGLLKAVITSTSLELGIDIGNIDLVILLGSPKSVTRAIQRIGRSGHSLHEISEGKIVVLDRDDLIECIVLAENARKRMLDKIYIPKNPLDVLAQHIVGMAIERDWDIREAYALVKKSYTFSTLEWNDFLNVIKYLSGNDGMLEKRNVYGKIWYDESQGKFGRKGKMVRVIYYMNSGTIPDEVSIRVFTKSKEYVGKLEEEFAEKLTPGDIFVLGGKTYKFVSIRNMMVTVENAPSMKPTIPAWFSEMLPLHYDLGNKIRMFRDEMAKKMDEKQDISNYIAKVYKVNLQTAKAVETYFKEQKAYIGIPYYNELYVEHIIEENLNHYVFHTLIGRKSNDAVSRALAYGLSKVHKHNVKVIINDNGFVITSKMAISKKEIETILQMNLEELLKSSISSSEILKRRFRHVAIRGFLILRKYKSHTISVHRQQFNAEILIKLLKENMPEFPILKEAYREVMEDSMDLKNAQHYWEDLKTKKIKIIMKENLSMPSPFAFNLFMAGESDIILMEDRISFIQEMHKKLMQSIKEKENAHAEG